jgi:FkbM family methyltransferase
VSSLLKAVLKTLRASQPFNCLATGAVRTIVEATGLRSEKVIKHLHRVGRVRSRLPNGRILRLWSRGDDWVSNQVYWRGWAGYEPETVPLFFRLASQAQVTLDVGAHVGFFTLLAGHAKPGGRVYAFEPMPAVYERLRYNVALNQLDNVECLASAAGETDGHADFYHIAEGLPSSSSLSLEFMRSGGVDLHYTRTPVLRLDKFVRERSVGRVDLLKIDTESTEPQVLRGMTGVLERHRPNIVCEVLKGRGSETALQDILRPFGYRHYLLTPKGPELRERIEGHPTWLNYLFTMSELEEVRRLASPI